MHVAHTETYKLLIDIFTFVYQKQIFWKTQKDVASWIWTWNWRLQLYGPRITNRVVYWSYGNVWNILDSSYKKIPVFVCLRGLKHSFSSFSL